MAAADFGIFAGLAALAVAAGVARAEPVDGRAAERMLFSPKGFDVVMVPGSGLSATDQAVLAQLFKLKEKDLKLLDQLPGVSAADRASAKAVFAQFKDARYYGAVAAAPGDGLVAPGTQIAQNLHSPEAAAAAALRACNTLAKTTCVVVAEVLPRRFKRQPLMLSAEATEGLKAYRKGKGPKAMAISAATNVWAVARGFGAGTGARRECERLASVLGASDCAVVIADD
jgi:hypothetical protein